MMEAAKDAGIWEVLLLRYFDLQAAPWPLGAMIRAFSMLRNRMLADPSFLFKVGTGWVRLRCRREEMIFWAEFELYAADLVGVAVDIALVGLLAPYAIIGKPSAASTGLFGRFIRMAGSLPSRCFFKLKDQAADSQSSKESELLLQGVSKNQMKIFLFSRSLKVQLCGVCSSLYHLTHATRSSMAWSEASPAARRVPPAAVAFTVGVHFANNIYGGMQFVD